MKDNAKCFPNSGPGSCRECYVNKVPSRYNDIRKEVLVIFIKETKILKENKFSSRSVAPFYQIALVRK
jgi:hypothetical protein